MNNSSLVCIGFEVIKKIRGIIHNDKYELSIEYQIVLSLLTLFVFYRMLINKL